jgi:dienelactone hydrolase
LKSQPNVDPKRIAAIGYCFGGTAALELARGGADLAAVVVFHAGLETPNPADAKNIKAACWRVSEAPTNSARPRP